MNPQGEEEEIKESDLRLILENSQSRQLNAMVDNEIAELTKGGVAAINRQSEV